MNDNRRHRLAARLSVALGFLLLGGLGLYLVGCGSDRAAAEWKIPPDPTIVSFPVDEADSVVQELVAPPFLPVHEQVASGPPRVVSIRMEIREREEEIAPGVFVWQMAFNNSVPGPVPVVFQWDWVNLTLVNGSSDTIRFQRRDGGNTMPHNIDFHAATGALGGAELTLVAPGQEVGLRWRAVKAGFFVYHCAPGGQMVPYHVVTGGNGAILVLPREGLRDGYGNPVRYDKAFYFGEQDYYVPMNEDGTSRRFNNFAEQMGPMLEVMRGLTPTHIAFNGKYGSLTQDIRLEAAVGETVLLLHSQANNPSYPHLIGGHGDWVWPFAKFNNRPLEGLESWEVVAGGTAAAVYTFRQPGTYVYLNHNLIKAFLYDAKAFIHVTGDWSDDLMTNPFEQRPIGGG
jgi:nitrite reductase (NO-forming)